MTEHLMTDADALSGADVDRRPCADRGGPHGLDNLFGLRVRQNPACATVEKFMARHTRKRWLEHWSRLSVVGREGGIAVYPTWLRRTAHDPLRNSESQI